MTATVPITRRSARRARSLGGVEVARLSSMRLALGCGLWSGWEKGEDGEHAAAAIRGFWQAEFQEDGAHV